MRLLNDKNILTYLNSKKITILNFSENHLQHSSYDFRLGNHFYKNNKIMEVHPEQSLRINPKELIIVNTLETFTLTDEVFGILSNHSSIISLMLDLKYTQFIDPLYTGPLKLGLYNYSAEKVDIKVGSEIGKVCFFDIADSGGFKLRADSRQGKKFKIRNTLENLFGDDDLVRFIDPSSYNQ